VVLLLATLLLPVVLNAQGRPFELEGLKGGSLTPADFAQGAVIVVVWASWSPQCRNIDSRVEALAERWGSQARVIMVNFQEDRSEVEAFLGSRDSRVPVYLDTTGGFSKKYSVTNLPGLLIFRDGNTAFSGKLSRDPNSIISQTLG
jgi:thiol-disulfide isomerase/thioredoxin